VQHFYKQGVKATKEGWEKDCFCLHDTCVNLSVEKSLFDRIQPIHEDYTGLLLSETSVKSHKIRQKTYNRERSIRRNNHWNKLKGIYFKSDVGVLQIQGPGERYFVPCEPMKDLTNQNPWREGGYQWFLVVAAIALGIYSYLAIGTKVETEEAVQEGMKVLEDVGYSQWLAFAAYNLIVLIYYHRLLINNIKSGWSVFVSVLFCSWYGASGKLKLETTFKPTWQ